MSQKSSVPQAISFVSQVLKRDTARHLQRYQFRLYRQRPRAGLTWTGPEQRTC